MTGVPAPALQMPMHGQMNTPLPDKDGLMGYLTSHKS